MLEIFDTHAHYHAEQFDEDRDEILTSMHRGFARPQKESGQDASREEARTAQDARENGSPAEEAYRIRTIVDIAAEKDSLDRVMELVRRYDFMYGAIGLHPDEIADLDDETEAYMETLLAHPKIVAVGEIGIDYYWNKEAGDVQIAGFQRQIGMAVRHGLPIIVHSREAAADTMSVVQSNAERIAEAVKKRRLEQQPAEGKQEIFACPGIIHCYSYSAEHARMYAGMGFMLGIGGVVTYKNAKKLREVVREIPLRNLVLETDCPYLAPTPFRGKRNDSRLLVYAAEEIASIKQISVEEVVKTTAQNAEKLFGI
ncbi:MAG: TatD family hydrolase [Lachnospiraceae bacterium]|nr:TatD family hydrolase [Lachnospiraceae bacterium]